MRRRLRDDGCATLAHLRPPRRDTDSGMRVDQLAGRRQLAFHFNHGLRIVEAPSRNCLPRAAV